MSVITDRSFSYLQLDNKYEKVTNDFILSVMKFHLDLALFFATYRIFLR